MEQLSLREKSVLTLIRNVKPLKKFIKQWFYHAGMKFLQAHDLSDNEELFLEKVTDFYMQNLEEIDEDAKFFKRVTLGPVQLPTPKGAKVKTSC